MKINYELISFIQGKRRRAILNFLKEGVKTPKQIASKCNLSISNISNTLSELIEKGLIICKNPKSHINRYFEITFKGKELLSQSDSI